MTPLPLVEDPVEAAEVAAAVDEDDRECARSPAAVVVAAVGTALALAAALDAAGALKEGTTEGVALTMRVVVDAAEPPPL